MVRAVLVLALLLATGCLGDSGAPIPARPTPGTGADTDTKDALTLHGTLAPDTIRPGEMTTAAFRVENHGKNATTLVGGCGSDPWRFEIVAENGTRVGPIGPDPRCLGPPMQEAMLPTGGVLASELRWDGNAKFRDADHRVHQSPAPTGVYELRAMIDVHRGDALTTLTVVLRVNVSD